MSFDKLLQEKNMNIKELAKLSGVPEPTIFRAKREEFQNLKFQSVIKLCQALNCLPHEIISGTFEKEIELEEQERMIAYSFVELPEFSGNEKKYIADMLNGSMYNINILPQQYLQMQVLDSNEYDGLADKWQVDSIELSKKVRNLTAHQAYTIIKTIRDWWNKPDSERDLDNIF